MKRIFLIGYMGAGKSTVGRRLASHLQLSFIDLDSFIEKRFHKTINEIFTEKGEEAFRKMEKEALEEVSEYENVIISVGGGTPCFFDNIERMNQSGYSIYLQVSPEVLASRLNIGKHSRPLLRYKSEDEIKTFVIESLAKREPYYNKATCVFEASSYNVANGIENLVLDLSLEIEKNANQ